MGLDDGSGSNNPKGWDFMPTSAGEVLKRKGEQQFPDEFPDHVRARDLLMRNETKDDLSDAEKAELAVLHENCRTGGFRKNPIEPLPPAW